MENVEPDNLEPDNLVKLTNDDVHYELFGGPHDGLRFWFGAGLTEYKLRGPVSDRPVFYSRQSAAMGRLYFEGYG